MTALASPRLRTQPRDDAAERFAIHVIEGLSAQPKWLSPKYFYDQTGSQLFEEITRLPEYYPTRTELSILTDKAKAIAALIPKGAALVEFGAGSATKVRILLEAAPHITAYVPVDISAEFLGHEATRLSRDIPRVKVYPVAADFTESFGLPAAVAAQPRVGFFPGSTIGNFDPPEAAAFLKRAARILGPGALLIVGADLIKDAAVLNAAYNDAAGVTAQFNLNLLARMNRELGTRFVPKWFRHHAFFNAELSRIEMHLVSRRKHKVRVGDTTFEFRNGESIHTESSYKFTLPGFDALARGSGWATSAVYCDSDKHFSVHVLAREADEQARWG